MLEQKIVEQIRKLWGRPQMLSHSLVGGGEEFCEVSLGNAKYED